MEILRIESISKSFHQTTILNDISFVVKKGDIVGLLGTNGSGKTTLIRIITQILSEDKGDVLFDKSLVPDHNSIGYLPEERGLYPKMKVGDQLIYLGQLKGMSKALATSEAKKLLRELDLLSRWKDNVNTLSKGQQQKIQLISTLIHNPSFVILDEPFSGLDPVNYQEIIELIERIRSKGATILLSTHRMESVEDLCNKIILIHNGNKILEGEIEELKKSDEDLFYKIQFTGADLDIDFSIYNCQLCASKLENERLHTWEIKCNSIADMNRLIHHSLSCREIVSFQKNIPSIREVYLREIKNIKL